MAEAWLRKVDEQTAATTQQQREHAIKMHKLENEGLGLLFAHEFPAEEDLPKERKISLLPDSDPNLIALYGNYTDLDVVMRRIEDAGDHGSEYTHYGLEMQIQPTFDGMRDEDKRPTEIRVRHPRPAYGGAIPEIKIISPKKTFIKFEHYKGGTFQQNWEDMSKISLIQTLNFLADKYVAALKQPAPSSLQS